MSLLSGYFSLGQTTNKVGDTASEEEGVVSSLLPELELSMDDKDLTALKDMWIKNWLPYARIIEQKQKENENYWLGNHFTTSDSKRPLVDNLIFEALETFLPIATRPKAEPLVEADNSEEGNKIADKTAKMIKVVADNVSYNLKMKQVARYWALYMLGVIKVGWSMKENDISCVALRPQKMILDPQAHIEECEYTGYYLGEYVEDMASDLVLRFPKKKQFITDKVKGKMGTQLQYIFWSTDDYIFWSMDNEILGKSKNPNWNYETKSEPTQSIDEFGQPIEVPGEIIKGRNHFRSPKKPYVFLSVFNLGKQPHDDTNLIQQNLSLQDLVNKRLSQIDKNADNANGGLIVSGDAFTEEQAQKMGKSLRKGGAVWVPTGDVNTSVKRDTGTPLPSFVYESLVDYRNEIRNIFGTRGSSAQGTIAEDTLGGKQIIKGQDSDRIGGGVSTFLEQFSDHVYNWFVQLMYVYYDEPHEATVLGAENAKEHVTLINSDFGDLKLLVGVKEGSMIPQDPMSKRNEAVELWSQKGIDPISFFERLDFPNPRESAKNLYLWNADPVQLFPDLLEQQQVQQAAMQQEQMQQSQDQQMMQQEQSQSKAEQDQANKLQQIEFQNLLKQQ